MKVCPCVTTGPDLVYHTSISTHRAGGRVGGVPFRTVVYDFGEEPPQSWLATRYVLCEDLFNVGLHRCQPLS